MPWVYVICYICVYVIWHECTLYDVCVSYMTCVYVIWHVCTLYDVCVRYMTCVGVSALTNWRFPPSWERETCDVSAKCSTAGLRVAACRTPRNTTRLRGRKSSTTVSPQTSLLRALTRRVGGKRFCRLWTSSVDLIIVFNLHDTH